MHAVEIRHALVRGLPKLSANARNPGMGANLARWPVSDNRSGIIRYNPLLWKRLRITLIPLDTLRHSHL